MTQTIDLEEVISEFRGFDTLLMATCNNAGVPEASYAPYIHYQRPRGEPEARNFRQLVSNS